MHGVDPWRNASWQEEEASVSAEENKALMRRLLEAEDKGDLDALDELLAPDFVDHNPLPGQEPGREGYIQGVAQDHAALSIALTTVDYQATDGDMVITRFTTRTIHDRGEYFGVGPTGQERETTGIFIHRISRGKIAEEWSAGSTSPILEDLAQEIRGRDVPRLREKGQRDRVREEPTTR
jgi:ketosteroid isomerase-like protein